MKKFNRALGYVFSAMLFLSSAFLLVPFISFDSTPYDEIVANAAHIYGFKEGDYLVEFKDELYSNRGSEVYGLYLGRMLKENKIVHRIQVRNVSIHPMMVATIFHEFAHAAQAEYKLDREGYTLEQHAEILSFTMMWDNDYRWDAMHLLPTHMFGKSSEYRAVEEVFSIAFGSSRVVSFNLVENEFGIMVAK